MAAHSLCVLYGGPDYFRRGQNELNGVSRLKVVVADTSLSRNLVVQHQFVCLASRSLKSEGRIRGNVERRKIAIEC